jgi:hypothetical protein
MMKPTPTLFPADNISAPVDGSQADTAIVTEQAASDASAQSTSSNEPAAQEQEAAPAPEINYDILNDIKLEGIELDQGRLGVFKELAAKHNLPAGVAKETAEIGAGIVNSFIQDFVKNQQEIYANARIEEQKALEGSWVDNLKADPEWGGSNFEATAELAGRFVERFGIVDAVNETRMGNHPEFIKLFAKIEQHFSNDTHGYGKQAENSLAAKEYTKMTTHEKVENL